MKHYTVGLFAFILIPLFLFSPMAQAAQYDIKTMTPEIQAALSNRQARYNSLQQFKDQGAIGENNHGYAEVLNAAAGASDLAGAENNDRRIIYQAIADQNDLGSSGLSLVETVFAEVIQGKSSPGQMIQTSDGQWLKK